MVDYSKWNNIDLSDDDSDCHPNIEKNTWLRMKKDTKLRKAEEAAALAMREDAEHEADRKRAAEIEEKLRAEDSESLRQEHAKLVSKMNAHIAKRAKQAEMEKKYPKWDEASICRDGFSKTIVNKPASQTTTTTTASSSSSSATTTTTATPSPAPFVPSKKVVAPVVTEPSRIGKAALTGRSQEQIVALENKAHYFAKLHSFEDMYQYIGLNRDIINPDVQTYLLLYCSDNLKRGQDTASKRYLRASCVVQYCKDLGPDGIALFFARYAHNICLLHFC